MSLSAHPIDVLTFVHLGWCWSYVGKLFFDRTDVKVESKHEKANCRGNPPALTHEQFKWTKK